MMGAGLESASRACCEWHVMSQVPFLMAAISVVSAVFLSTAMRHANESQRFGGIFLKGTSRSMASGALISLGGMGAMA